MVAVATLVACVSLGAVGASVGGSSRWRGAARTGVGGAAALAVTYVIGTLVGTAID